MSIITKRPANWINTWISKNYCRHWGLHEGLRELLCNQYDGICDSIKKEKVEPEKMENGTDYLFCDSNNKDIIYGGINYDKEKQTLMIWNNGSLAASNLLLGGTKDIQNSVDIIGRFGEGMKLSALSLIRENSKRNKKDNDTQLNIYTEGKIWRFKIQETVGFKNKDGAEQLCLHWKCENYPKPEYTNKVVCEIIGISEEEWRAEQDNYLWLTHREIGAIQVYEEGKEKINENLVGEVLCDKFFRRKIFVKEVFINYTGKEIDMTSYFGFNVDIDLDRDRNSVKNLSQRNKLISKILSIILNELDYYINEQKAPKFWIDKFPKKLYKLLYKGYNLVYYINENIHTQKACDEIYKIWREKNGNVFPAYYRDEVHIKDILLKYRLPNDFYPYSNSSGWLMDPILKKSKYFKAIEDKFQEELNSKENITPDANHEQALKEIIEKVKKVKTDFTRDKIIFKNFDKAFYELHYNDKGKVVLPSVFLNENIDKKWKCKICGTIFDVYEIKSSQVIDVFNIF